MTRDEAERAYVEAIMERGNPQYFIWKYLEPISDWSLVEMMQEMVIEIDEIEDEE